LSPTGPLFLLAHLCNLPRSNFKTPGGGLRWLRELGPAGPEAKPSLNSSHFPFFFYEMDLTFIVRAGIDPTGPIQSLAQTLDQAGHSGRHA